MTEPPVDAATARAEFAPELRTKITHTRDRTTETTMTEPTPPPAAPSDPPPFGVGEFRAAPNVPRIAERFRLDTADLGDDLGPRVRDWVRTLGLDPDGYKSTFEITREHNVWHLHLTQVLRDPAGHAVIVDNDTVNTPVDVVLGDLPDLPWLHDLLGAEREKARASRD